MSKKIGIIRYIIIFQSMLMLMACGVQKVPTGFLKSDGSTLEPGLIGITDNSIFYSAYKKKGFIQIHEPLRIEVVTQLTTALDQPERSVFRDYLNHNEIDSLNIPKYLFKISISDQIGLLENLNDATNTANKSYLQINPHAHIVTEINTLMQDDKIKMLRDAHEMFLKGPGNKGYMILAYDKDGNRKEIVLDAKEVLTYNVQYPCWEKTSKTPLNVVSFRSSKDKCPKGTVSNAKKALKKVNYLKL